MPNDSGRRSDSEIKIPGGDNTEISFQKACWIAGSTQVIQPELAVTSRLLISHIRARLTARFGAEYKVDIVLNELPNSLRVGVPWLNQILDYLLPIALAGRSGRIVIRTETYLSSTAEEGPWEARHLALRISIHQGSLLQNKHTESKDPREKLSQLAESIEASGGVVVSKLDSSHRLSYHVLVPIART
jgi:hypothetical protein